MKDDSFVNLVYFLSIENNYNTNPIPVNANNLNNTMHTKRTSNNNLNINNNNNTNLTGQKNSNKNVNMNNVNNNNNNINYDNPKIRTTKKIIKRKSDMNIVNGGVINPENERKKSNRKSEKKNLPKPDNFTNNINNEKYINYNSNNKTINYKKRPSLFKTENNIQSSHDKNKKDIKSTGNLPQEDYLGLSNANNQKNNKSNINGKNTNINNNKKTENIKNINSKEKKGNKNTNIDNLNINEFLYSSASPKKKAVMEKNNSINKIDFSQISIPTNDNQEGGGASVILNTSDCFSVLTNKNDKNDKLNITINTNENNASEAEYKILSNNNIIKDKFNIYSKNYLSKLDFKEYEYDTFCQAIIKTGLSENKMSLSKYSENFPAPCGHELCSKLPALEPNVLTFYQNLNKSNIIDVKQDATSHLIFPLGIKLCVQQDYYNEELDNEPLINTIYNIKGDIYYIASLTYYRKITIKNYNKIFSINPINVYNKYKQEKKEKEKNNNQNFNNNFNPNFNINNNNSINYFKINNNNNIASKNNSESNLKNNFERNNSNLQKTNTITTEENNKKINFNEKKDDILIFSENDVIYIPESLSLVSRFPYFNQLSKCLKIIINMRRQVINGDNNQQITKNISLFINHLINQVPIGNNKLNILFYTPINIEPITLYNPFCYNFGNFTCNNIFSILNIENIITIFLLVLLEQKIIFVDKSHLMLSAISFFFLNLIYPLSWVNTYQPLLSLSTIRYIQSITPFIMGGNENLILYAYHKKYIIYNENYDNIDKSNIVFVSLTNNLISCDCYNLITNKKGQNRKQILKYLGIPDLPKSIEKKLYNHLSEIEKVDNLKTMNEKLKTFFCRIMVFILDDYKDYYLYSLDKPIFNKDNYLMCKKEDKKIFYKELLGTQLFTQFIFCENELYKNKKLGGKKLKIKQNTYGIMHDGIYKDDTFFMKNKNKIEDLKIMIKKRRKEKLRKSILSAKKIVKNLGQMIYGTNDDKKKGNYKEKSVRKVHKANISNISVIKHKKDGNKINSVLLMPYFIEEPHLLYSDIEKYDYIQNKLNTIISLDNQLNQINNYKNKYIFDFNQKFDLKLLRDDNTRYFIGMIKEEENDNNKVYSLLNKSSNELKSNQNNGKNLKKSAKLTYFSKNNNNKNPSEEEENKYIQSKQNINIWFTNIYLASSKKKLSNNIDIHEELKNEKIRKFFSKLISQNYTTLFDIKENNINFLNNESFMELLLKIKILLSNMTFKEFETCKLITLSCFKYFTILEEHKHTKLYLYNKYTDLYTPCNLWQDNIFWKSWFDEDVSFVEKRLNVSNENDYSLDLKNTNDEDNELYEYNEESNNCSIEYKLLIKISFVMNSLKLEEDFVKKVIFDDLAPNYLTEEEINIFKEQYEY